MYLKVKNQELDIILAGLRLWQQKSHTADSDLLEIAGAHGEPLSDLEIDDLCIRLNTTDTPRPKRRQT